MEIKVVKMSIVLREKDQKDRILWAFMDKDGHTIMQVYSEKYPADMENYLKND
jgi:hypothetical protein